MTETFRLGGDPATIRLSAGTWSRFAADAGGAASDLRGLDTGEFVGDEADDYRGSIHTDLVPHLDTAAQAWGIVSTALYSYAGTLEQLQARMSALATQAQHQQDSVTAADRTLRDARSADLHNTLATQQATAALKPGESLPPNAYVSHASSASTSLGNARAALQGTIDAANTVRGEHHEALTVCGAEIDRAKHLRFTRPPGFFGGLKDSVVTFVSDHSGVLLEISSVLKMVSAVSGVLALIPVLTPIMGPIMLATGAAALAIDVTVKLCTGQGSWLQMGVDTLALIPGVKSLTLLGRTGGVLSEVGELKTLWKGVELVSSAGTTALTTVQAVRGDKSWTDAVVSGLGMKLPVKSDRFKAVQGLVAGGADVVNKGGTIAYKYATGEKVTGQDWFNLGVSVGKTGVNAGKTYAYRTAGTNPDGTARPAYKAPEYRMSDTKSGATNAYSSAKTSVQTGYTNAKTTLQGGVDAAKSSVSNAAGSAKQSVSTAANSAKQSISDATGSAKQSVSNAADTVRTGAAKAVAGAALWVALHRKP